jgi:hypothetical protein
MLTKITAVILLFALFGIVWTSDAIDGTNISTGMNSIEPSSFSQSYLSGGSTVMNESSYKNFLSTVQGMYREDIGYSEHILKNSANKNISDRDAMVAMASVFMLASHSIALLETNEPPKIYAGSYNNTLLGMIYLKAFLWNMSKFYETNGSSSSTNRNFYLVQARMSLNDSVSYYRAGQEALSSSKT